MNPASSERVRLAVLEHHEQLVAYLTNKTRNVETAREIAQETYEKVLKINNIEDISNLKAYLYQVATNLAIDRARRRNLHHGFLARERAGDGSLNSHTSPSSEQVASGRERLERLQSAVNGLPPKCRRAFLMHRLENQTYPEIAARLSVSVSMVEKYIMQALKACHASVDGPGA